MELVTQREDYDSISWSTRLHLARKYHQLMEALEPYASGDTGEVQAGLVAVYLRTAQQLGALFDTGKRPHEVVEQGVPAVKVQAMLQEQLERFNASLEAAVAQAVQRGRDEVLLELRERERLSLEAGRDEVRRSLQVTRLRLGG